MFYETITHASGESKGNASESHALFLLRRALRRGYTIEATPAGGALIHWTRTELRSGHKVQRSITLAPYTPVGDLNETAVRHLNVINDCGTAGYEFHDQRRIITAGMYEVPPMDTALLRGRALVTCGDTGYVRLTFTAQLGLLAQQHRTRTTEPQGWTRPSDAGTATAGLNKPGRRAGLVNATASAALCTCGEFTAYGAGREEARARARGHRELVAADFVGSLSPAFTAAVASTR